MAALHSPPGAKTGSGAGIRREVLPSPSRHVQLALVHVAGPSADIGPEPYLRVSYNIGPNYVIDATGPQGRQTFACRRHALLVIPPDTGVLHHAGMPKPAGRPYVPAQLATFRISRELVADCAIALGLAPQQAQMEHQVIVSDEVVRPIAQALLADLRGGCPDGAPATERLASALVARILQRQQRSGPTATAGAIARVKAHVDGHLNEPLALDELAELAGMSVFHFCRVFRERLGATPHQYILAQRITQAKRLLWQKERGGGGEPASVLDIALACGFTSPSHFAAQFKRHTGCTPLQWTRRREGDAEGFR